MAIISEIHLLKVSGLSTSTIRNTHHYWGGHFPNWDCHYHCDLATVQVSLSQNGIDL